MESLQLQLREFFENQKGFVGIAVSGGSDSMVLMHICAKYSKDLIVLHINHQTRKECLEESQFINDQCQKLGIVFVELRAEGLSLDMPNFEESARKERYRLLSEYAENNKITQILTAHHQDDLVETIFLKLFRSSLNIFIPKSRLINSSKDIFLYRPLLSITKNEINAYIQDNDILYKEDISNSDDKYLRNYIRNKLLPLMRKKVGDFDKKMSVLSLHRQEEEEFLTDYTSQKINEIFPDDKGDLELFLKEHSVIQGRILQQKLLQYKQNPISIKQVKEILRVLNITKQYSIVLWQKEALFLLKEGSKIQFFCENKAKSLEKNTIIVHNNKIYWDNLFFEIISNKGEGIQFSEKDKISLETIDKDDKIDWNNGTKKLSQFIKDRKIPKPKHILVRKIIKNDEVIGMIYEDFVYLIPKVRVKNNTDKGLKILAK